MKSQKYDSNGFSTVGLILVLVVVIIAGGLGWYAWQLRTESQEPEASQSSTQEVAQPQVVKKGSFKNVGEKTGSGDVSLIKNTGGTYSLRLEDNFEVQTGPALYVAFGNGEAYAEGTNFAPLKSVSGKQEYAVPASVDVAKYSSVIIWCEEFSVAFAAADLK